jgi:hypothetical protein
MDDLDVITAQFEEDVARINIFTNGDETADYTTEDGRAVPSLSKVIANVDEMLRPDIEAIDSALQASQAAASSAGQSAQAASGSAGTASNDAATAQAAALSTQADAIAAGDDADRAEAAKDAASSARDEAVGAQNSVQQNADAAASSATRASASETAAAASATQTGLDLQAVEELATEAAGSALAADQSVTTAGQSATQAAQSATAAGESATAAAESAREAAQGAPGLVLLETQGPDGGGVNQNIFRNLTGPYDQYEMVVSGLVAYQDLSQFSVQFSYDNGVSFINTQYASVQIFNSGTNMTVGSLTNQNTIAMWGNMSGILVGAPWGQINGIIRFFNLATPARMPYVTFDLGGIGSTGAITRLTGSGALQALPGTPVNALRIFGSSHGFSAGALSLYGRRRGQ